MAIKKNENANSLETKKDQKRNKKTEEKLKCKAKQRQSTE